MDTLQCESIEQPIIIDSSLEDAALQFGEALNECLESFDQEYDEIIFLCIGSDRATGDSLGPLTGYKLTDTLSDYDNIRIYGTLETPVHATNLTQKISFIYKYHKNPLVIAIDASLGDLSNVGFLSVRKGYANPGSGVGKSLPLVGDIAITGTVNYNGSIKLLILQNTSLNIVMKMADIISSGIYYGLQLFYSA